MTLFKQITLMASLALPLTFASCELDEIEVHTGSARNITQTRATVTSEIETEKSLKNCTFGVLYSTSKHDVEDGCGSEATTKTITSDGSFTVDLFFTNLNGNYPPHTKFFYRAYVIKKNEWYYGKTRYLYTTED